MSTDSHETKQSPTNKFGPQLSDLTKKLEHLLVKALMIEQKLNGSVSTILTVRNTTSNYKNAQKAIEGMHKIAAQFNATLSQDSSTIILSQKPTDIKTTEQAIEALNLHLTSLRTVTRAAGKDRNTEVMSINTIVDTTIAASDTSAQAISKITQAISKATQQIIKANHSQAISAAASTIVPANTTLKRDDPLVTEQKMSVRDVQHFEMQHQHQMQSLSQHGQDLPPSVSTTQTTQTTQTVLAIDKSTLDTNPSQLALLNTLKEQIQALTSEVNSLKQQIATTTQQNQQSHSLSTERIYPAPAILPPQYTRTPSNPGQQSLLEQFYKEVRENPGVQVKESNGLDVAKTEKANHIQFLAGTLGNMQPLQDAPNFVRQADGTYKITPGSHSVNGPIFMSRVDQYGQQCKNDQGKPIYDILHYENGKLNPLKSFIAPDGVPEGSKPTIDPETRQEVLKAHAAQAQNIAASKQQNGQEDLNPKMSPKIVEQALRIGSETTKAAEHSTFTARATMQAQAARGRSG